MTMLDSHDFWIVWGPNPDSPTGRGPIGVATNKAEARLAKEELDAQAGVPIHSITSSVITPDPRT